MQTKIITARLLRDGDTIIEKRFGGDTEFYVEQAESVQRNQVKASNDGRTSFYDADECLHILVAWA